MGVAERLRGSARPARAADRVGCFGPDPSSTHAESRPLDENGAGAKILLPQKDQSSSATANPVPKGSLNSHSGKHCLQIWLNKHRAPNVIRQLPACRYQF